MVIKFPPADLHSLLRCGSSCLQFHLHSEQLLLRFFKNLHEFVSFLSLDY